MKKFFKILFIVLAILFVLILTLPLIFKGTIMRIAKEEANKNVRATVDWDDISISLIRGFPNLMVSLEEVSVIGIDNFEGDTLVAFENFSVKVDLISAISGKINVKSVILDRPIVRAIALKDGSVNWDIAIPSEEVEEEVTDTSSTDMQINLKEFLIRDGNIQYYDEELNVYAVIEKFNLELSGNFSEDLTDLDLNTSSEALTVEYDGVKYLNKVFFGLKALLSADMVNSIYTIKDNEISINKIIMGMEGEVSMPNDDDINVDVRFFTKETDFKSLLSLIPAIYMQDFEGLQASGTLAIEGDAIGTVNENVSPKVNLSVKVNNGRFAYPDLPKSAENIQMDLQVFYDGVIEDNTKIDLNTFHVEMAGNPLDMNFHIITPMSDMQMNGAVKGRVDLNSLSDVIPVEDMKLGGIINANIEIMGKYSDIENENYEAFNASGTLDVTDIEISGVDVPVPVLIRKAGMSFTPQFVQLSSFEALMGNSDISMQGRLENFIPYVLKDEVIRGELAMTSSLMDINELMGDTTETETETVEDTAALTIIEIPANIDFRVSTIIDKLIYDNLIIEKLNGRLTIKDAIMSMDKLSMNLLEGSIVMSGEYNTQDPIIPTVDLDLSMNNIDIASSFHTFNTVEKLAPVAEMAKGNVSVDFAFTSDIDSAMSPVLNSIVGSGKLRTDEVQIVNNNTLNKVAGLLKNDKLKDPSFKDVNLSFEIHDGRVYVKPFDAKIGTAKVNIGGDQGLDQTINYKLGFSIPRNEFGSTANDVLENLTSQARSKGFDIKPGDNIEVNVGITGSFSDPKLSMNLKEGMQNIKDDVKEAIIEKAKEEVEKVKETVREDVSERVDKIMKDAEGEADKVRRTAAEAGEALIGEAQLRKKQLVKEAGNNPVKKMVAEKSGDELVKSAQKQSENLKKEADVKANAILAEATKRAEEIKSK